MSNRTLVELNHDYCPREEKLLDWAKAMRYYMSSGDPKLLPQGVEFKHFRHHSEPEPITELRANLDEQEPELEKLRYMVRKYQRYFCCNEEHSPLLDSCEDDHTHCLICALEAAEAEAAALRERERWIPVEEKLPEVGQKVLVWVLDDNSECGGEKREYADVWEYETGHPYFPSRDKNQRVTHWKAAVRRPGGGD